MWSENRGIESYIFFAIFPIVINISTNAIYFISGKSYEVIEIINEFNGFTLFTLLFCCIVNFFTKDRKLSDDEIKVINKKMYGMKLLNIVFIGYIIFTIFIVRNVSIMVSALIMYIGYINFYMFKRRIKIGSILSKTQKNWREFHNKPSYEDISLLWRIKPMITPHVSVRFTERIKHINLIGLIFILPLFSDIDLIAIPIMIIICMFSISDFLYLIDAILGLYTETEGICTGIVMKESSRPRRTSYEVYATDFFNEREVKFRVYDYCKYNENDVIKIIHGGLSKKVIEAKIVSKNFM